MATPQTRHFAFAVIAALACSGAGAATATAAAKADYFPQSCQRASLDPAVRTLKKADSWRFSKPYKFPFYGYTERGRNTVIWGFIKGSAVRKAPYPSPNLPSCRVARFGTEDRAAHKAGKYFAMLEPVDGQRSYQFRDSFDRPIANLVWRDKSPVSYHPSRWGWYINGKWAGHDATRAFELQATACKLVPTPDLVAGGWKWNRDSRYVMVSFAPNLGSPGRGAAPKGVKSLRVRAFLDRRAVPAALQWYADTYDHGCGSSLLAPMLAPTLLRAPTFSSGISAARDHLRGYYFGEGKTTIATLPGERRIDNKFALSVYNPRPHYNHATYVMVNTTGVAGGGIVRGIVQSTKDRLTVLDEMRYCDPNYTLRGMQIRKGKKHYKKSLYFEPYTFSAQNQPAVRWIFGRVDPDRSTLGPEAQAASINPVGPGLFGWFPIRCDR